MSKFDAPSTTHLLALRLDLALGCLDLEVVADERLGQRFAVAGQEPLDPGHDLVARAEPTDDVRLDVRLDVGADRSGLDFSGVRGRALLHQGSSTQNMRTLTLVRAARGCEGPATGAAAIGATAGATGDAPPITIPSASSWSRRR